MAGTVKAGLITFVVLALIRLPLVLTQDQPTPRDQLLYDDHSPLGENQDDLWKAKFDDFGAEIRSVIKDMPEASNPTTDEQVRILKGWCGAGGRGLSRGVSYDTYLRLCSTEFRTVKGLLLSLGREMPTTDNDWKIIWLENKGDTDFISAINGAQVDAVNHIGSTTGTDTAHKTLKGACEYWLSTDLELGKYGYALRWCLKSNVGTVESMLSKFDFARPGDGDFKRLSGAWSNDQKYQSFVGEARDENGLKAKCGEVLAKNLYELDDYDNSMLNIYNFCNGHAPLSGGSEYRNKLSTRI